MEDKKITKQERSWILYDVANSAFIMIVTATIPVYFANLTKEAGISPEHSTSLWGTSTSIAIIILAIMAPILGALADYQNMKKKFFLVFLIIGVCGAVAFTLAPTWLTFLIFFIVSRLGWSACNIFYDAMLIDVTTDERMDTVSTYGYAFGYIGSCIPFILGIALILTTPFGLDTIMATRISFLFTFAWWIVLSIPLFLHVKQEHYLKPRKDFVRHSFKRLGITFGKLKKDKKLLFFVLGYFFFIDGVYTIISMATTYGAEVGIDTTLMIVALLITQFVAFPCAIIAGKLSKKVGAMKLIKIFIIMYACISVFGYFLNTAVEFWILAVSVGMCQGGIQALSRSQFGKMIPKKESSEYFGFFDIFGKFADFIGPLILAGCAYFLGSSKYGVLALTVLFIIGFILIVISDQYEQVAIVEIEEDIE